MEDTPLNNLLPGDDWEGKKDHVYGRTLACCIPLRLTASSWQLLLISSRSGGGMLFPKGGWETDTGETLDHAAVREAYEEGGVTGTLETPHFATFEYQSSKPVSSSPISNSRKVYVYVLFVEKEHEEWPEQHARTRQWVDIDINQADAVAAMLKHEWMRDAWNVFIKDHYKRIHG